jgi:signal transduction histidine kinase
MDTAADQRSPDHVRELEDHARELEDHVRLYEAVLRTGPVFARVYDGEMNSRWSTAALRPELGYEGSAPISAEENYAFVHPDDRARARREAGDLLRGGDPELSRLRVRAADGEWRWLAILAANLLDDPDIGSIVVHSWDITGEVRHEEEVHASGRLLTALIDTLDEAVIVVAGGEVAFANAKVAEHFRTVGDPRALIGRSVLDVQTAFSEAMADPRAFLDSTRQIVAGSEAVRGRFVETADGRILEQHFLPIGVGERVARRMWVYRDVTAQLNLERRQQRLLTLERDARHSLEEQNERLRQLDDLKTAFVATVSHELRTPLTAMRSHIDLLLDPEGEALGGEQRVLVEAARRGALRLGRLVDDLLVLAQLQTGSLPVERSPVDVPDAVADAIDDVSRGAPDDIVIVQQLDGGPPAATDRVRLMQIVSNLVGNAAKFAEGEVRCTASRRNGDWIVEILDDGPGIAPAELQRIFEPFYRGRPGGRGRQGTGLGLPISAQLADLLGGSLTVANNETTSGVVARLTVPIDDEEEDRDQR